MQTVLVAMVCQVEILCLQWPLPRFNIDSPLLNRSKEPLSRQDGPETCTSGFYVTSVAADLDVHHDIISSFWHRALPGPQTTHNSKDEINYLQELLSAVAMFDSSTYGRQHEKGRNLTQDKPLPILSLRSQRCRRVLQVYIDDFDKKWEPRTLLASKTQPER
eukprot:5622803-Amphidinium_carterae.1